MSNASSRAEILACIAAALHLMKRGMIERTLLGSRLILVSGKLTLVSTVIADGAPPHPGSLDSLTFRRKPVDLPHHLQITRKVHSKMVSVLNVIWDDEGNIHVKTFAPTAWKKSLRPRKLARRHHLWVTRQVRR